MNETALIKTLQGHTDGVLTLAFSPCGKFLATAGEDNTIRLWDNPDGIEIQTIQAHKGDIRCLAFDPDGDVFASGSWDKTIRIWQTSDCATLAEASNHEGAVNCLAFSPDGKRLYSGSDDDTIRIFSSPGGSLTDTLKPGIGDIKALAISAKGLLAAGGVELQLLDLSGKLLKNNDNYLHGVKGLAFSPDGRLLALATGMEKRFELWNMETMEEAGSVKDTDWLNCVTFTPDGKFLVTGGGSAVKVWDPATGACLKTYEGHADEIYAVDVSPDGKCIASASNDKTVKLWAL
ncbi:MAG TPA: WD40 repeat domain-containing protein [Elusimicrobiales bacterium]|nr:WD40 repeat domain-containing protein [Elusimicrobiales bacterium]